MRIGQSKCPYCGHIMSTSINERQEHFNLCSKNPDNWDDVDDEAKQWINPKAEE